MHPALRGSFIRGALLGGAWALLAVAAHAQSRGVTLLDAIRSTLDRHPELKAQREAVNASRGLEEQAASKFDVLFAAGLDQQRVNAPLQAAERRSFLADGFSAVDSQASSLTSLTAGATKLYRGGLGLDLSTALTRTVDNLVYDAGVSRSTIAAGLTIPMAAGRGRAVVAADETAANLTTRSTLLDVTHTTARLVAATAASYWNLAAAKKQLEVTTGSEQRGRQFYDNLTALVDADQVPRNDLHNVAANLAERTGSRFAAEQLVVNFERDLAMSMGTDPAALAAFPDAIDDLPPAPAGVPPLDEQTVDCLVQAALRNRADLQALRLRVQAAQVRATAARDRQRPRVDARVSVGYTGVRDGLGVDRYLGSLLEGQRGGDVQVGIRYAPQRPSLAAGEILETQAAVREAELRVDDLDRSIRASVVAAASAVRNGAARWRSASASVAAFERALDGQREKLRLGMASIVEVLTVEDRLTNALVRFVDAQLAYPKAVIDLRFATGTILRPEQAADPFDLTVFFEAPACPAPAGAAAPVR